MSICNSKSKCKVQNELEQLSLDTMEFTEIYSEHLMSYEDFENLTEFFLDREVDDSRGNSLGKGMRIQSIMVHMHWESGESGYE